jgi:molybdate transport system substrate-binding protein
MKNLAAALVVVLLSFVPALAQKITVAAAADLQAVMPEIVSRYHQQTGKDVDVVYGSSGNLSQQIQNGAPFDLFFSANLDFARKLDSAGFAEPGSLFEYAIGRIVLWAPADSKLDINKGLRGLVDPAVKKIAIANPEHAPYGQAAVAAMKKEGVYDQLHDKLVLGENISQTASFVASGAADVGVLALSLARAPNLRDKGHFVEIPADEYPAIEQGCVVIKASSKKADAQAFVTFFKTAPVKTLLEQYGFAVPAAK